MLNHITENNARYEWDAHVLLTMHNSNLAHWCACMTDPLNKGDELCVYSLCDMLKQHAFIFTRTKPWTMVDGSIANLTITELCMICDVHLIYLGDNNFGVLKYKPHMMSPLTSPTAKAAPEPTPQAVNHQHTPVQSPETESGTVVGILSEDLNSRTVITLQQSPIASELEAVKSLLALKSESNSQDQDTNITKTEHPTGDTLDIAMESVEKTEEGKPVSPTSLFNNRPEADSTSSVTETPMVISKACIVETNAVEMNQPTVQDDSTPGGVVIVPLPSRPVTPVTLYPANKVINSIPVKPSSSTSHNQPTIAVIQTKKSSIP